MLLKLLAALALAAAPALAYADPAVQTFLEQTLVAACEKSGVPAIAAMVQIDGRPTAAAAVGLRAVGHIEPVTLRDRWHIGSDTKAFTSTLIARLVERGAMSFDDTLATSFPAFARDIDPAYRHVTVLQLLSHTAGLSSLTDPKDLPPFLATLKTAKGVLAQRAAIARMYLTRPPAHKIGQFEYSNVGYMIAAAVAEARTGKVWEDLIREQIFVPLGISNAGFGPPGTPGKVDQPRGHVETMGKLTPVDPASDDSDNPPAFGPAGRISITLADWMLFAQDQLDGEHGRGKLLSAEMYRKLHTPVTGNYALGWGAKLAPDGAPSILAHTGSNGLWVAEVRIMPKRDVIFLVATNAGNEAANEVVQKIVGTLGARLKALE